LGLFEPPVADGCDRVGDRGSRGGDNGWPWCCCFCCRCCAGEEGHESGRRRRSCRFSKVVTVTSRLRSNPRSPVFPPRSPPGLVTLPLHTMVCVILSTMAWTPSSFACASGSTPSTEQTAGGSNADVGAPI
ncbi:unnamed protein product, partial [Ectocarpus sp. 8 AP-2014]